MQITRRFFAFALAVALAACSGGDPTAPRTIPVTVPDTTTTERYITVMTRNIYLGASLDPVMGAPSPQLIPVRVADVWAQLQRTNFPERARALADEIAAAKPDLIGLQEVSLWRTQFPGDAHTGAGVPATEIALDFLAILLDELASRGLHYVVSASVENFDAELFMFTGAPGASPTRDIRLTDRDVILAKNEVVTWNPRSSRFATNASLSVGGAGGPPVTIFRGWNSVDARYHGVSFRFFNTHLEVESAPFAPVQVAQGNELISQMQASPFPIIAVGDFNSAADGSSTPTYGSLREIGLVDVWAEANPSLPGYTGGRFSELTDPVTMFQWRIDHILFLGPMSARSAWIVGASDAERTPSGLLPSDHAGVVATIHIGNKR